MGVNISAVGFIRQLQGVVSVSAAGDGCDNIQAAGLEVFDLGRGNGLLVDDLADLRGGAFIVALEVFVLFQDSGGVGVVEGLHNIGTGPGELSIVFRAGFGAQLFDLGSLQVLALSILGIEFIGQVAAVAVILDFNAFAQERGSGLSSKAAIRNLVEVIGVISRNRNTEGVFINQVNTGQFLGAFFASGTGVELIGAFPADGRTAGGFAGGSFRIHRRQAGHRSGNIVFRGDGAAVGELQVILNFNGVGQGAVFVDGFFMRIHNGIVPGESAFLGGFNSAQANSQAVDVIVRRAGRVLAEGRHAELAGQFGGRTQDDGIIFLLGRPVNQSTGGRPEGVGGIFLNALDLRVVQIVILVAVQRNFGQQVIPAGDVQFPPGGVDVIFGLVLTGGGAVVNHGHGQEVQTKQFLLTINSDVAEAGFFVFFHISDSDASANLFVQGGVILAILVVAKGHHVEFGLIRNVGRVNGFSESGAEHGDCHDNCQDQCQQFLHKGSLL